MKLALKGYKLQEVLVGYFCSHLMGFLLNPPAELCLCCSSSLPQFVCVLLRASCVSLHLLLKVSHHEPRPVCGVLRRGTVLQRGTLSQYDFISKTLIFLTLLHNYVVKTRS